MSIAFIHSSAKFYTMRLRDPPKLQEVLGEAINTAKCDG